MVIQMNKKRISLFGLILLFNTLFLSSLYFINVLNDKYIKVDNQYRDLKEMINNTNNKYDEKILEIDLLKEEINNLKK